MNNERKPIEVIPPHYAGGKMPALDFWYPGFEIYACVDCGAEIRYFPASSNFSPPLKCYKCEGVKFSHSLDDEWQPDIAPQSVTGRTCLNCGTNIDHLRPQAVTCSPKCRKALSRKKTG